MVDMLPDIESLELKVEQAKLAGKLYVLTRLHVVGVLRGLRDGRISLDAATQWAEFFDVNEDVELEFEDISKVLFELSSPEINGIPSGERINELLSRMDQL
jgi:hypothetical protein